MAQPLKCVRLLSLEEMALRRLSAVLWNDSDILASVMNLLYHESNLKKWESVIDRMKDKIKKLELPDSLTMRMVDVVRPIGLQIKRWGDFHVKAFDLSRIEIFEQASVKLCFTTAGTVDNRRMAQEIVRCNKINVVQRYVMACSYWLEDCIPILWKELSEEQKEFYYAKNLVAQGLQFSWSHIFKGELSNLDSYLRESDRNVTSFNQWAFEHSAKKGFKATAEYFFRKLSCEEREASLMRSAYAACSAVRVAPDYVCSKLVDVLHYLLSLMTREQQTEIVKAHPVMVMSCFFEWSRQELFSENAGLIWPFLSPSHYWDLLRTFFSYSPCCPREFFKESPLDLKKYITDTNSPSSGFSIFFLDDFFDSEDCECIELLFRSADVEARVELVFNHMVLQLFYDSIERGKWRLVEVCLREATLTTEDRKKLKVAFLEYLNRLLYWSRRLASPGTEMPQMPDARNPKLKCFFDFLDATDTGVEEENKGQKRKLENCSPE